MQWNNSKLSDCHAEMEHTSPQTYRRTIDTLPQMCTHRRATLILQKERCLKNIINTGQRWCWCSSSRYTCHHQTRQLPCCWNPILYPDCFLDVGKRAQPQRLDVDTWPAKFELWTCDFDFAEHSKIPLNVAWEFDKHCGNWQSHSVRDSTRLWKWLHIAQELFVAASA